MNNREAFEAAVKECGDEEQFSNNMPLSRVCYAYFIHGVNAALASQAKQNHSEDDLNMVQSQAQQSRWISVEERLPAYGQIVDLSIDGVLQNETYEIDATDNDLYLTHFWTRDGLDDGLDIEQGQFWRARLPKPLPPAPEGVDNEQSQAQQESQALKALKGMIELWFRTRESGCLPIEVAHAQFVLKTLLPQSQAQQAESKPALKVVNGEICYKSTDDDQSYGMWCPVSYDTKHSYKEGTKFIVIPPAPMNEVNKPEGDKP